MKNIVLLTFIAIFVSCSMIKPTYVPRSERIKQCVKELIIKDVKPLDASAICDKIYRGEL